MPHPRNMTDDELRAECDRIWAEMEDMGHGNTTVDDHRRLGVVQRELFKRLPRVGDEF